MPTQLRYPDLYAGTLVRLAAQDPERDAAAFARWTTNSELRRWADGDAVRPESAAHVRAAMEQRAEHGRSFPFGIHLLTTGQFIGYVGLWVISWPNAEAFVGIGLGEQANLSQGFGTDAMRLALRFGFHELNLERISLEANADNARAIRSYEKCGFVHEGTQREWDGRDGQREHIISMGLLRADWEQADQPA